MNTIIGRNKELVKFQKLIASKKPELLAIYGRRRIGKTYLIRNAFKNNICFEFSGLHNATMPDQLQNFSLNLNKFNSSKKRTTTPPKNWLEAFNQLEFYLDRLKSTKKKVVFIDEFPWLATRKSRFLSAFENFWNAYASKRNDLIVVICGSAASYMVEKIIRNKGGLHNRITEKIRLLPFNLNETSLFLKSKGISYSSYDILQLYMALGGVPHYLEHIEKGKSIAQNIDALCFSPDGFLVDEFDLIFASLFENSHFHKAMIILMGSVRKGITRNDIIYSKKFSSGGTLTKILNELTESGFITQYAPYNGTVKQTIYRLTDEYSFFYLKFIRNKKILGAGTWLNFFPKQSYKSWSGFSFETLCLKHINQLKKALGITQVYTEQSSWFTPASLNESGAQIDLLIDRADNIISICEMKFSNEKYTITKDYSQKLKHKANRFKGVTKTRKNIFLTMITTYSLNENIHSLELVQNTITAEALFESD